MENVKLMVFESAKMLGESVNYHLMKMNNVSTSFISPIKADRFSSGDGKVIVKETIRDNDIFVLSDVHNCSITYNMRGFVNHMSPDDHMQDIRSLLSALRNQPSRVSLIMPFLYASRQHKRKANESMNCAATLRELESHGVSNFITFDAHEPSVGCNAINNCFENFFATNLLLDEFYNSEEVDVNNLVVIAPDGGATERAGFYADLLCCRRGTFSKKRDLTKVVNGKNPIIGHDYLGDDINGMDAIVVDDMISSGDSLMDVSVELKKRGVKKVFFFTTFALLVDGPDRFNKAYLDGKFDKLYTTNFTYMSEDVKALPWMKCVDCSILIARIIDSLAKHNPLRSIYDEKPKCFEKIRMIKNI